MKSVEEVLVSLLRPLRLCQGYQAQQKARHDKDNHYLEKPSVRLFGRSLHNVAIARAGSTTPVSMKSRGSQRSLAKVAHKVLVDYAVVARLPHSARSCR